MPYTADPNSLRLHSVPIWFLEAKFGIFIHWSLSSIISPRTAHVHRMLGVWIVTILGLCMGITWTAPRTSRKVEARKGFEN